MTRIKGILGILALMLIISACGDDEPRNVSVSFQMNVGDDALVEESVYSINDTDVRFTNVALYLGDVEFETSNGVTYESSQPYYLVEPGTYNFGFTIPEDVEGDVNLNSASFFIGVDAITNSESEMDFTERAEGDPLGQQNPSMHWGWAGGYRFISIDGEADVDGDGEFETMLTYHLGRDEYLKTFTLTPNVKLEGGENSFEIIFDMAQFLDGLDFANENFTKVRPEDADLTNKIFANYDSAVSFVE